MIDWKIKDGAARDLLEIMIFAATSVVLTRWYLSFYNWPVIGRGVWHVSHALTGGVVMFLGILMMVIWEGKSLRKTSLAIIGVGWGWFIDELGKLVTRDNDYFFRPAVMMIYIVFIGLFLGYRFLKRKEKTVENTGIKEKWLRKIISRKKLIWVLWGYSIIYSSGKIMEFVYMMLSRGRMRTVQNIFENYGLVEKNDLLLIWMKVIVDTVISVMFLMGARWYWSKKRLRGLSFFQIGMTMSILISSVIRFYFEQMGGVYELLISMFLLELLNQYKKEIVKG